MSPTAKSKVEVVVPSQIDGDDAKPERKPNKLENVRFEIIGCTYSIRIE
mgnify:CR=1